MLASRREGLRVAVVEAWAFDLPVVPSATTGCTEKVEHERDGLLLPASLFLSGLGGTIVERYHAARQHFCFSALPKRQVWVVGFGPSGR